MKKLVILSLLLVYSFVGYAQKPDTLKNSIQKNAESMGQGGNNDLKSIFYLPYLVYLKLATNDY